MKTLHEKINYIQTTLKAPKGQFNKYGNFKYRSLEDIQEALKPLLKETGLSLIIQDDIVLVGERYYVKATAILSDGEKEIKAQAFAREPANKKGMDEAQITGATSSYARKYCLNGLFSIDDTKDADTEEYTAKAKQTTQRESITDNKKTNYEKLVKEKATKLKTSSKKIHTMIQKNLGLEYNSKNVNKFIEEVQKL
ncbi:MAG: hypothetical protein PWP15_1141 [Methanothermococcus sp.]|uniref:ERF family protein n=1 Tax=Methanothermococcus sp. TaxID=2614238 RepID=UPI00258893FA|nr:ERF family protein [Methanothermococcus sp.]MDK2790634.1 hypothetical protein [Methanothermococcus sp.]